MSHWQTPDILAVLTFAYALHGFAAVTVAHDHIPLGQLRLGRDGSFATRADGSVQQGGIDCRVCQYGG